MRVRVIVETDCCGNIKSFRNAVRLALQSGALAKAIPGTIVYVANEIVAEPAVLSHDGIIVTVD